MKRKLIFAVVLMFALVAEGSSTLLFMTDFGDTDDSVAICKGVMLGIAPDLRIIDISHLVTPFSILDGARFLAGASPYYTAGSVFNVVIDPGVGSARKAIVVKSKKGQYFVLPDNGLITLVEQRDGVESIREITNTSWMIGSALSSTFHGRDIFSPVAAHIARGDDWTQVGPELTDHVRLKVDTARIEPDGLHGTAIALDGPYGNVITNIDAPDFQRLNYSYGDRVALRLGKQTVTVHFAKTFSDVPLRHPLLYVDSRGHIALALNQGNFANTYHINPPVEIFIPEKSK
jgi:S-adenosylmethionine hydrolase